MDDPLANAQQQVDSMLSIYNLNEINNTKYLLFKNDEVSFCRDNVLHSLAIPRPEVPISKFQHQGSEDSEFELTQLSSDPESYMCMLKRRNRTWTVKLRNREPEYVKREFRNHIYVFNIMVCHWVCATLHLRTSYRTAKGTRKAKWLESPRIPLLEPEPIAYQVCEDGIVPAGLMMEYIPPMHRDHARALANSYIDPSILRSVKCDPDVGNVRFQIRLGEQMPPDDARNTKLLSRCVYIDQLYRQRNVRHWTDQMAVSLALLHWKCKLDGAGVEFHLAPRYQRKTPKLWMTHFGDCKTLEGEDKTTAMAEAFFNNPAWPRPGCYATKEASPADRDWGDKAWVRFMKTYSSTSNNLLENDPEKDLPSLFLDKVKLMAKESRAEEQESSTD